MRIVPRSGRDQAIANEAWDAELEAALTGDRPGSMADSWRELREDVRALAPPMDPEFEHRLRERITERATRRRPLKVSRAKFTGTNTLAAAVPSAKPTSRTGSAPVIKRLRPQLSSLRPSTRYGATGAIAMVAAAVAVMVIAGPWRTGASRGPVSRAASSHPRPATPEHAGHAAQGSTTAATASTDSGAASEGAGHAAQGSTTAATESTRAGAASAPGRVQQLAASISLAPTPNDVQATADSVARLTVSEGGFVESSHVQVQQRGTSEANLTLRLPSAKLSAALASLAQLAPVRTESQSLQDITDAYDAARRRLSDARAERQALLRALSAATTQGQIDSLRVQLSQARSAIAAARSGLQTVSHRASTAEVEVTVVGDEQAGSEGLTLHRGLHDAGRVLVFALVALLVTAAVLVPLAILLTVLATGRGAWRRYRRERVLDAP